MDSSPTSPLRLAPVDPQNMFPWMEEGTRMALAIPDCDLAFWRGRKDVYANPAFFAVRFEMMASPRYNILKKKLRKAGLPAEYGLAALWLAIGYAMKAEPPGILAHRGEPIHPEQILDFWHLPSDDVGPFARALDICRDAGWLVLRELRTPDGGSPDVRVRARTRTCMTDGRRRTKTDDRTSNKSQPPVNCSGHGSPEPGHSGHESPKGPSESSERTANERASERASSSGNEVGRASEDRPTDEGSNPPWVRNRANQNLYASTDRYWVDIPLDCESFTLMAIADKLLRVRSQSGLIPYPKDDRDGRDLRMAIAKAVQDQTIPDLLKVLQRAAGECEHGGGFRAYMSKAGFLPPLWKQRSGKEP